jgi:hypothetical protein
MPTPCEMQPGRIFHLKVVAAIAFPPVRFANRRDKERAHATPMHDAKIAILTYTPFCTCSSITD